MAGLIEKPAAGLDLPLDMRGTAFQQLVWGAVQNIPPGSTATYTDIARQIGDAWSGPRGGPGMRRECTGRCHPVPPRDQKRWLPLRLSLGSGTETCASRKRGARMRISYPRNMAMTARNGGSVSSRSATRQLYVRKLSIGSRSGKS